jgi:hypothetical protein
MPKSATELVQEILFSTVLDSIAGLKAASGGLPNQLVRDIGTIHPNTTFADLPKEVQDAIGANVRLAFTRLLKEGYSIAQGAPEPARPRPQPQGPRPPRSGPPRDRPAGAAPRGGGPRRPPGKPGPPRG